MKVDEKMKKAWVFGMVILLLVAALIFLRIILFPTGPSPILERCYTQVNSKLEEMKAKLEIVAAERTQETINFEFGECSNPGEENISIKTYLTEALCTPYCDMGKNACELLAYDYTGPNAFSIRKCLSIPTNTIFQSNTNENCPEIAGKSLVDFREGIAQGTYYLASSAESANQLICAYKVVDNE